MELTVKQALKQGIAAHKEGKLQDAERLYRAILLSQPKHPDANHNLGILAVSVDQVDLAIPLFETALEANPTIEQYWLSYINALIRQRKIELATKVLEKSRNRGFDEKKLNDLSAILQQPSPSKKRKGKKSKKNFSDKNPPPDTLSKLIQLYADGEYEDAKKLASSITHKFPKHPRAWKYLGATLAVLGQYSEAVDVNKTAVALSPRDATVHFNLGSMLENTGRLDEAAISFRHAIELAPEFTEARKRLGKTLLKLGRHQEGLKERRLAEGVMSFDLQVGLTIT